MQLQSGDYIFTIIKSKVLFNEKKEPNRFYV